MIIFLFFPENKLWYFMQNVSSGDKLHEISEPIFWENENKILQNVVYWTFNPAS